MWTHFQKIYSWRRYRPFKTISKTWFTSVTLLRFWFRIIASKLLIFEVCLSLKERLVATFDETRAPTSRKSEVFQDLDIPKLTPKYKFLCHTPAFSFYNNGLKMIIFEVRLPLKKPLVTTLTETRPFTSRNYEVIKKDWMFENIKKCKLLLWHSLVLL